MIETNKIINGDCIEVMKTLPEGCIDLVVTSCPYGVGIDYDVYDDDVEFEDYKVFSKQWLTEVYRVLKDDGRIALNIPYEINRQKKGGRIFFVSEMWQIMKEIGFGFFGIVDLEEESPHRSKTTAWGCYDKETKVMTDKGLKFFKDVDIKNDLFVTLNIKTNNIEYQKAFDYIEKPFSGKLISIKHRGVDLLITDNHNMVVSENNNNFIRPYNEITSNSFSIPKQHNGLVSGQNIDKITIPSVSYGLRTKKEYRKDTPIEIAIS